MFFWVGHNNRSSFSATKSTYQPFLQVIPQPHSHLTPFYLSRKLAGEQKKNHGPPKVVVLLCPSSLNLARALLIQSTWRFVGSIHGTSGMSTYIDTVIKSTIHVGKYTNRPMDPSWIMTAPGNFQLKHPLFQHASSCHIRLDWTNETNNKQANKETITLWGKQFFLEDQNSRLIYDFGQPNLKHTSNTNTSERKSAQQKASNKNLTCLSATQTWLLEAFLEQICKKESLTVIEIL